MQLCHLTVHSYHQPPQWPVGEASSLRADQQITSSFLCTSHTSVFKTGSLWLSRQAPGVIMSVLGLDGLESVYVTRWNSKFDVQLLASVWQHAKFSKQIRPRSTLCMLSGCHSTKKQSFISLVRWDSKFDVQLLLSVWQHATFSEQIHCRSTLYMLLDCYPTKKQLFTSLVGFRDF